MSKCSTFPIGTPNGILAHHLWVEYVPRASICRYLDVRWSCKNPIAGPVFTLSNASHVQQDSLGAPSLTPRAKAPDDVSSIENQKLACRLDRRVQITCHFRAGTRLRGTTERSSICSSPALLLSLSRVGGKDGKSGLYAAGKGSVIVITATRFFIRNLFVVGLGDLCEVHVEVHLKACRHWVAEGWWCRHVVCACELVVAKSSGCLPQSVCTISASWCLCIRCSYFHSEASVWSGYQN